MEQVLGIRSKDTEEKSALQIAQQLLRKKFDGSSQGTSRMGKGTLKPFGGTAEMESSINT